MSKVYIGLKGYTKKARLEGYRVSGGLNGGGWIRLAHAIGEECTTKAEARSALKKKFATVIYQAPVPAPQTKMVQKASCAVESDAFLSTYEWRRLRMEALKKYGARCQCCGATPATGAVMNVDHIKPRRLFPQLALDLSNLQILCGDCNHGKGNWDMTDWRSESPSLTNGVGGGFEVKSRYGAD